MPSSELSGLQVAFLEALALACARRMAPKGQVQPKPTVAPVAEPAA